MKKTICGNTDGIKSTLIERLEAVYDIKMEQTEFASHELVNELAELTGILGREISVYVARDGSILNVSIGDTSKVDMPSMRVVRNEDRLCGVRCIHTHPNGDGRLSGVDIGTLRSMKLDSMSAIGVREGAAATFYAGFLGEMVDGERKTLMAGPLRPYKLPNKQLIDEIYIADASMKSTTKDVEEATQERVVLIGLENSEGYDTLGELAELARTAGAEVVYRSMQKRRGADNATYIGSGKAEELALAASECEADMFIVDDEITAAQIRNLENILHTRVIDRTALILDIFAQRAESREGKLQVELAQLKYNLTRLIGQGQAMSRLGGGIGTRGPGEKKLEIDRRRIKRRIFELSEELNEIAKQRDLRRAKREKNPIPLVALVGYTNAGKSTLLNAISDAGVLAEDKLFATLDPVVRQVELDEGTNALFSDTVGFINKLPHDLVEAFKSTLDEVKKADLILHVVDCSSDYYDKQMRVVEDVITSLGAFDTPRINVYNKIDKLDADTPRIGDNDIVISAKNGEGVAQLLKKVEHILNSTRATLDTVIPYDKYETMTLIRNEGRIIKEEHTEEGTHIIAQLDESSMWKIKRLLGD